MQGNDLSNATSPCIYVVWEGLIATTGEESRFQRYVKTRRSEKALALYERHTRAVTAMWQVIRRGPFNVAVLTYLPPAVAALLPDRLTLDHVPFYEVLVTTPAAMAEQIPYMPWIAAVVDPDPSRALLYGSFGRHVPPEHAEMIGWLQ
jgi:hypothetical protein